MDLPIRAVTARAAPAEFVFNRRAAGRMGGMNGLDLRRIVTQSADSVFRTMLSIELAPGEAPEPVGAASGRHIVGMVGLAGAVMGNVSLLVSREFAREMTAAMLGVEAGDIDDEEAVNDVIGEVCNMVGGDLKSRLCDAGLGCSLSIPSITCGDSFRIETKGWDRHERICLRNSHHAALLEVFVKSAT
jgi:chemotaxis protein CheX